MSDPLVIKAGDALIPFRDIAEIDISDVEREIITLTTTRGRLYVAEGFDAIEAVMLLKPSALEGRRLRWNHGAWAFHNLVAHPVMQIMVWAGFKKAAIRLHDSTTPRPRQPSV